MKNTTVTCQLSGRTIPRSEAVRCSGLSESLLEEIRKKVPQLDENGFVSIMELHKLRSERLQKLFEKDKGEISLVEKEVLEGIVKNELMSKDLDFDAGPITFGERLADKIAEFGGSWKFILLFGAFLFAWIIVNVCVLALKPFDPYPFILLNLILSCIAALQAPVIMMSQNRMESKDRQRAQNDYKVNLKAEIEIRQLHEKMDHLILRQMEHLIEIQQIQIDLLNELGEKGKK